MENILDLEIWIVIVEWSQLVVEDNLIDKNDR